MIVWNTLQNMPVGEKVDVLVKRWDGLTDSFNYYRTSGMIVKDGGPIVSGIQVYAYEITKKDQCVVGWFRPPGIPKTHPCGATDINDISDVEYKEPWH